MQTLASAQVGMAGGTVAAIAGLSACMRDVWIESQFMINTNNILFISADNKASKKSQEFFVTTEKDCLSQEEL